MVLERSEILVVNEYIDCQHCGKRIANKHILKYGSFESPVIIIPINAQVSKVKIEGREYHPMFLWDSSDSGYSLKTQLKCNNCKKHTTVETISYTNK